MSSAVRSLASPLVPLALVLIGASPIASAVEPLDTFSARLGGYVSSIDTQIRADGIVTGTDIELDRDLNLDQDDSIAVVGLTWRPFEHHEFSFSYHKDDASASRQLQRDIIFDDTVYPASATVRSEFGVDAYEASYVWWAASHENWALGPRLGLVWYKINFRIDLERDVAGNPPIASFGNEVNVDLPEPTIGGSWRWTPAEQWRISADVGYFSANVDNVDADVLFGRAGVEWYPWENFGFWLDYKISDVDGDIEKEDLNGSIGFRDSGVRLGVAYRF